MGAGLPKYVVVNLDDLEKAFEAGATVNLDTIKEKNLLNISGRDARLPLKVCRCYCTQVRACACRLSALRCALHVHNVALVAAQLRRTVRRLPAAAALAGAAAASGSQQRGG